MSLAIDVDTITAVLIAGTWYPALDNSFALDSYEYLWWEQGRDARNQHGGDIDPVLMHGGGQSGICATGYVFTTPTPNGPARMYGPLNHIQAVRTAPVTPGDPS